jgi:arabinosaccharide transport system permease protein
LVAKKQVLSSELFIKRVIVYIALGLLTILALGPVWIMLVNATRSTEEIVQGISIMPSRYMINNWKVLSSRGTFNAMRGLANSLIVSCGYTFLAVYFGALAAYGFHVYDFKGRKFLFTVVLGVIMIPAQLTTIGYYQYMSRVGLTNTLYPLILPGLASSTTVFFLKQYISSTLPLELVSAGRVDGANEFSIFHRIALPMMAPGMATMAIFAFVVSWNNFMLPSIILTSSEKYTLPLMVQMLKGDAFRVEYGALYLGIAISVIPIILAYIVFSKFIISGITAGGVKE